MNDLINIIFKESNDLKKSQLGFRFEESNFVFYYPKQISHMFNQSLSKVDKFQNMTILLKILKKYDKDGLNNENEINSNDLDKFLAILELLDDFKENGLFYIIKKSNHIHGKTSWTDVFKKVPLLIDDFFFYDIEDFKNNKIDQEDYFFKLYQKTIQDIHELLGLSFSSEEFDDFELIDKSSTIFNFLNENFRDRDQKIGTLLKTIYIDENGNDYQQEKKEIKNISYITDFYFLFEKLVNDYIYSEVISDDYSKKLENGVDSQQHIEYSHSKEIAHKQKNNNPLKIDGFFQFPNNEKTKLSKELQKIIGRKEQNQSEKYFFIVDSKFVDEIKGGHDVPKQFIYYSIFSTISKVLKDSNSFFNVFIKSSEKSTEMDVYAELKGTNNEQVDFFWKLYPNINLNIDNQIKKEIENQLEAIFGKIYEIEISVSDLIRWKMKR